MHARKAECLLAIIASAAPLLGASPVSAIGQTITATATSPAAASHSENGCQAVDEAPQCLAEAFVRADRQINDSYQRLLATAPAKSRADIIAQQRSWLDRRDSTCRLDARRSRSSSWVQYVLADYNRAVCVLRLANERTAELDVLTGVYAKLSRGDSTGVVFEAVPRHSDAEYMAMSTDAHQRGRWYFEVIIDLGNVRSQLEAMLSIGIGEPDNQSNLGTIYHIRPMDLIVKAPEGGSVTIVNGNMGEDAHLSKAIVGIAADLDAGRVYIRRGTTWVNGAPGSSGGIEVRLGRDYRAVVNSSVVLQDLVQQGIVTANFGGEPFVDAIPDGYQPFEPRAGAATGVPRAASVFQPPLSRVADQSTDFWARRFWQWARSFPAELRPAADFTGDRCAAGQAGPVWFLAGVEGGGTVERSCNVPAGVTLLVPITNTLTWTSPNVTEPCDALLLRLSEWTSRGANLRLMVDDRSLEDPAAYHAATGCFELHDVPRAATGIVAADGYWVFVGPLPPGRHDIRFGARFPLDGFSQNVHYIINVQ